MIGTSLNQRFSLETELGRGGMGAVYRATDLVLQRPVAIKILKERAGDEVGAKIRLEAQILARLVHENVVRIYDFGESEGLYYFVMEEVDGSSYGRRARELGLSGRLRVLAQVADALDYSHHQGVIHRDVKPANVLMTRSDSAKLSDFGLSVLIETNQESGVIRGTPHYMSPEQAKGKRLDHRTDIYSLGVMLYEGVTGSPPFSGPPFAVMAGHANGTPDPIRSKNPTVSPGLESLILRMMEKSPENRPGSGAEVAQALRDLLAADPTIRPAPSTPSSTPPSIVAAEGTPGRDGEPTAATLRAPEVSTPPPPPVVATPLPVDLARRLLNDIVAMPIAITPNERYLAGHYLAYLLGGSRRQGFLRRRPLDPVNADRARLLLAMTWVMLRGPTDESITTAAELLDSRAEVRPALSPIVVAKYLAARDSPGKRRVFRDARKRLREASSYARDHMTDDRGVLNPGLLPQVLDDLRKIAPKRTEVDDQLVERWNRVGDSWRERADFREAVLGYATTQAIGDAAAASLWPEVIYPLIERARWQRGLRSKTEVLWDGFCEALHLPDAGNRLDRAIRRVVPARVVEELDASLDAFVDEPDLIEAFAEPAGRSDPAIRLSMNLDATRFDDLAADTDRSRGMVRLASPDPVRLTLGELRALYQDGVAAMKVPGSKAGHRNIPIGPYRLAVIPSIRGRSAGEIAIQGMPNKQIEMLIPSLRTSGASSKPIVAAYVYDDDSLAIAYVDFRNLTRFISWHAPTAHQNNFDDLSALNSTLLNLGLEVPDRIDLALSKRFRPRNPA